MVELIKQELPSVIDFDTSDENLPLPLLVRLCSDLHKTFT